MTLRFGGQRWRCSGKGESSLEQVRLTAGKELEEDVVK